MSKIILDLCGGTGSWSRPYMEAGYDVRIITLPDYDVRTYIPPDNVYGIFSNWEDVPKISLYTRPNRNKPNFAYLHKSEWVKIPQLAFHKPVTDAEFRAMTPPGFACAFYEANK